jgi:nitrate reductase (cytochrome), electron transfer subunit
MTEKKDEHPRGPSNHRLGAVLNHRLGDVLSHGPPARVVGIGSAAALMIVLVLVVGSLRTREARGPEHPPPLRLDAAEQPIALESGVFRLGADELGVAPSAARVGPAHARTIEMYRRIRAYPGAPPRVPHGLTEEEFRTSRCNVCHLRGGFVARFGTYAPVAPHAEFGSCLQCHAVADTLVGLPLPRVGSTDSCSQCHVDPDAAPPMFVAHNWVSTAWPGLGRRAMPEAPPSIPHGAQLRSSCLACHSGPGAVREIRTDHPERANCLQCHVFAPEDGGAGDPF